MKRNIFATLLLMFTVITATYAQVDPASLMKTYDKVKGQYDGLVTKWKPMKDMAIQNSDKLSPELKASMTDLDGQINSFGKKLDEFPKASVDQQAAMATSMKTDYSALKSSANDVMGQIKKVKMPKI